MTAQPARPAGTGQVPGVAVSTLLRELADAGITLRRADGDRLEVSTPRGALMPDLRDRIARCKADLLDWLDDTAARADRPPLPTIVPDPDGRHRPFPPSDLQHSYLVGSCEGLEYYVRPHQYMEWDRDDIDPVRFELALNQSLRRQQASLVVLREDMLLQTVTNPEPVVVRVDDMRGLPDVEAQAHLLQVRESMQQRELPLDRWPWLEARITRYGAGRARLHYNHNNFFIDGAGTNRLLESLWHHYDHPHEPLPDLSLSYRDCVLALADLEDSPSGRYAERYWRDRMGDWPGPPDLPLVAGADSRRRSNMTRRDVVLPAQQWAQFTQRASARGLSASTAVYSVYAEVISCWSGSRHFLLNNMVTHRMPLHPQIGEVLGNFATLYPLEVDWRPDEPFHARARRLAVRVMDDVAHMQWSGSKVLQTLNQVRGTPGRAACPFVVSSGLFMGRLDRPAFSRLETPQVLLDCQFWEQHDGSLWTAWDLIEEMFPAGLIDDMLHAYHTVLGRLAQDDAAWDVTAFDLLPPAQRDLRAQLNRSPGRPPDGLLHGRLRRFAEEFPSKPAVIAAERTLSYSQLYRCSAELCERLALVGMRPGDRVAVVLPKDCEQVVAVLAALGAGGTYVPLDPAWPDERVRYLIAETGAGAVLTNQVLTDRLTGLTHAPVIAVPTSTPPKTGADPSLWTGADRGVDPGLGTAEWPPVHREPGDLAYVIYTSGSTGRPKGAMLDHRGPLTTIRTINQRFEISADDVLFGFSSLCFDLSVHDVFGSIDAGATLVVDGAGASDPASWLDAVRRHRVTVWNSVPAVMELLVGEAIAAGVRLPGLRTVMLSGDWIPVRLPSLIREVAPSARVVSLGGATEASIWSICFPVDRPDPGWVSVPYGRPLAYQTCYVLDDTGRDAPTWTAGQLYIGGAGLAQGYLNDQAATDAAFGPHPRSGERLYRTGDRVRYLPGGDLEFLGRADFQVKIQGYRVEPGEVEHVLLEHPRVERAVVVARGASAGRQLAAFVTGARGGPPVEPDELRDFLVGRLPGYLVPSWLAVLERLPLTANGKVDRRALETLSPAEPVGAVDQVEPRTQTEKTMLAIWEEILAVSPIGVHDDFFALGGQSFAALQMVASIEQRLGVRLSIGVVLELRSIAALAERLDSPEAAWSPLVRITDGTGLPWFLVHPAGGQVMGYRGLAEATRRPCYAFQAPGPAVGRAALQTVPELAAEYLPALRQAQPRGPYTLGGWSSGGPIAFELAHRLELAGERVEAVVLIDVPAPVTPREVDDATTLLWFLEDLDLGFDAGRVSAAAAAELAEFAVLAPGERLDRALSLARGLGASEPRAERADLAATLAVFSGVVRACNGYRAPRIAADLTVLRAQSGAVTEFRDHPRAALPDWGWSALTSGRVRVARVPGTHHTMFDRRHVGALAAAVAVPPRLEGDR